MKYFVGIDPGVKGAMAVVAEDGYVINLIDMPKFPREVWGHFHLFQSLPGSVRVGIEWPSMRPGEGAERGRKFGIGLGYLEMAAIAEELTYERVAPNLWKGKLGLPGKQYAGAVRQSLEFALREYPDAESILTGPRGGAKDGRIDSLLIAHFLRIRSLSLTPWD